MCYGGRSSFSSNFPQLSRRTSLRDFNYGVFGQRGESAENGKYQQRRSACAFYVLYEYVVERKLQNLKCISEILDRAATMMYDFRSSAMGAYGSRTWIPCSIFVCSRTYFRVRRVTGHSAHEMYNLAKDVIGPNDKEKTRPTIWLMWRKTSSTNAILSCGGKGKEAKIKKLT